MLGSAEEASERAPSGRSKTSPCQCRTSARGARPPTTGSAGSWMSTWAKPISASPRPHLGAQGAGEELRPEADAEHRDLAVEGAGQPLALGRRAPGSASRSSALIGPPIATTPSIPRGRGSGSPASASTSSISTLVAEGVGDPVGALPGRVYEGEHGGQGTGRVAALRLAGCRSGRLRSSGRRRGRRGRPARWRSVPSPWAPPRSAASRSAGSASAGSQSAGPRSAGSRSRRSRSAASRSATAATAPERL